jgi:glycine cleavage system H protein
MWVAPHDSGEFTIGMDHVIPQLVDSIYGIVLPRRLTRLHRETPFAWLLANPGVLPLSAPLSGVIVDSNQSLSDHPEWLLGSSYDQAWIVRATCDSTETPEQLLIPAEQVTASTLGQVERMQTWIREHAIGRQAQESTLCDGGSSVRSLQELIGQKHYPHFLREFLSIRPR